MMSPGSNDLRSSLSAELRRRVADHLREHDQESTATAESFEENKNFMQSSASSETYTLGDESSVMNRNRLSPTPPRPFDTPAVQCGRNFTPYRFPSATLTEEYGLTVPTATVQRSAMCRASSIDGHGVWYILAMILTIIHGSSSWSAERYPSIFSNTFDNLKDKQSEYLNLAAFGSVVPSVVSVVANAAGPCFARVVSMYAYAADQIRGIAQDQVIRDIFATAMDIVLVIYAIGFLILSVYQATI